MTLLCNYCKKPNTIYHVVIFKEVNGHLKYVGCKDVSTIADISKE